MIISTLSNFDAIEGKQGIETYKVIQVVTNTTPPQIINRFGQIDSISHGRLLTDLVSELNINCTYESFGLEQLPILPDESPIKFVGAGICVVRESSIGENHIYSGKSLSYDKGLDIECLKETYKNKPDKRLTIIELAL